MTFDISKLKGRSLLTLNDLSDDEFSGLLDLADTLKSEKKAGKCGTRLASKHIALVFEKPSTRTRCATAVAVADEGGRTEFLSATETHLGKKESTADTARVLGRMFDGILFRGFHQDSLATLAQCSGIPVWNGLTDASHPTQALADLMTIREHFGVLKGLKVVYMGDGRNNVANSLMLGCAKAGVNFVDCTPEELMPDQGSVKDAGAVAERNGASVSVTHDPAEAMPGANVVCTDVWVSMGEESKFDERMRLLTPYQVNSDMMEKTGNIESGKAIFLHCLPAYHNDRTDLTRATGPMEVTDEVFEASYSKVFDEAENRMHTIKAMIVAMI